MPSLQDQFDDAMFEFSTGNIDGAIQRLQTILAQGDVRLSQIGIDKYGGRVDAAVATRTTADVSAALLSGGFARAYGGGKRGTWCG